MILLSSIINTSRVRFLERYKQHVLPSHKKALQSMAQCRQEHGPHMLARYTDHHCGKQTYIPHSYGHRNCPHCQSHENQQWIENQKKIYSLMFACIQDVLKTFTKNDKKLGGTAGFTAILHTHLRALNYHPHIHVVMPGASINMKTGLWRVKSADYLFSHKALAKVFRAKLLQSIVDKGLPVPGDCPKQWVVDCKSVGNGDKAIIYLGRYLCRGAIREQDILQCENGHVTRYAQLQIYRNAILG